MPYLIDAANLGGVLGGARGARDSAGVVAFLREWVRRRGRVVAVFDGPPDAAVADRYGPLEIEWSGAGRSADAAILRHLARGARGWIVVTDDRALARRSREAGAAVESASSFATRVPERRGRAQGGAAADGEKPAPSASELAHWRKTFGVDS